jgi:outer membrane protein assembly factor BamC
VSWVGALRVTGPRRLLGAVALALLLAGCSVSDAFRDATAIDYKSATRGPSLDIPPDLVTPRGDDRFAIPDRPSTGTTFSTYSRDRAEAPQRAAGGPVVMPQQPGVRLERQGMQRWLVIDQPPERVWPVVRDFWSQSGFALRTESPETGIMETDWAEKRIQPNDSFVRNQLTRVLGSRYATSERDKYRTRLESDGKITEVFVTHRGLTEEFTGTQKESTIWVPRPSDPELEAEFLRRLMLRFTPERTASLAPVPVAPGVSVPPAAPPDRARIVEAGGTTSLAMQDGFDRSWRQVGLALDRSGFTVEDRDRSKGTYFVRYVDPEQEARERGLIDRVFGTAPKKDLSGRRYRIVVEDAAQSGSRVGVLGDDGVPPTTDADKRVATRIVSVLHEQLR